MQDPEGGDSPSSMRKWKTAMDVQQSNGTDPAGNWQQLGDRHLVTTSFWTHLASDPLARGSLRHALLTEAETCPRLAEVLRTAINQAEEWTSMRSLHSCERQVKLSETLTVTAEPPDVQSSMLPAAPPVSKGIAEALIARPDLHEALLERYVGACELMADVCRQAGFPSLIHAGSVLSLVHQCSIPAHEDDHAQMAALRARLPRRLEAIARTEPSKAPTVEDRGLDLPEDSPGASGGDVCNELRLFRLASGSIDKKVKIWDPETGTCVGHLDDHMSSVTVLEGMVGDRIASGAKDQIVRIWDVQSGSCRQELIGHRSRVTSLCAVKCPGMSGDLASGSGDESVKIWDSSAGRCLTSLMGDCGVTSLASLDNRLVSGTKDKRVRIWDLTSGSLTMCLKGHSDQVSALAMLPDQGLIVSGAYDEEVRIWDITTGRCISVLPGHSMGVSCIAAIGGGRVAVGSLDGVLRIWDTAEERCLAALEGHQDQVTALTACGPGHFATGSRDQTVRIWSSDTGRCVQTIEAHSSWVMSLTVLPGIK